MTKRRVTCMAARVENKVPKVGTEGTDAPGNQTCMLKPLWRFDDRDGTGKVLIRVSVFRFFDQVF